MSEINNEISKSVGEVEENTSTVLPSKTTTFVEDGDVVLVDMSTKVDIAHSNPEYTTIKDFLAKPFLVQNHKWEAIGTSGVDSILAVFSPWNILTTNTMYADKLKGFAYIRGTVHLKIVLNAQPFQAGKLILSFIPCVQDNQMIPIIRNYNFVTKTQQPHVILDASESSATLSIPYIAPTDYCSLKDGLYDWGTFFLSVFNGLRTGSGALDVSAPYSVYMWFTDVELRGPLLPQSGKGSRKFNIKVVGKDEGESAIETGSVSKALSLSSKISSTLGDIPLLASVCKPLSWALDAAGKTAASFGYSKEVVLPAPMLATRAYDRFASCGDGSDISYPLAVSSRNALQRSDGHSIRSEDEMSINFLKKVECCTFQYTWSTSSDILVPIVNMTVRPDVFFNVGTLTKNSKITTFAIGHPIWYLSKLFKYWRGGIKIKFKIAKTVFHTGRLQVTYTPYYNVATNPTISTSQYSLREIIDIKTSNEFEFELPYLLPSDYLEIGAYMGKLDIRILNPLRCPATCSDTIDLNMFVSAADDFQFAGPSGGLPPTAKATGSTTVFYPETGEISGPIASAAAGKEGTLESSRCFGEHITSVRQLLLRNSLIQTASSLNCGAGDAVQYFPWHIANTHMITDGSIVKSRMGMDIYSFIAPMYAIYRGGMRVKPANSINGTNVYAASTHCGVELLDTPVPSCSILTGGNAFVNANWVSDSKYVGLGFTNPDVGLAQFKVPYYNNYKFSLVALGVANQIDTIVIEESTPKNLLHIFGFNGGYFNFRSIDDDFQFSYFMGCPPLYVSYA